MDTQNTRDQITSLLRTAELSSTEIAVVVGVSRQAILHHLRILVGSGEVVQTGSKRGPGTRYKLNSILSATLDLDGLEEHEVWYGLAGSLQPVSDIAADIHHYAFTEMLNNAIDHSEGVQVRVSVRRLADAFEVTVADDGVGAFQKIAADRNLVDLNHAVAELTKGKVTTDPERHTGEGIFFTSKAVDGFVLESNGLAWSTVNTPDGFDWAVAPSAVERGTTVTWQVSDGADRVLADLFNRYTTDHSFSRTSTQIRLFATGLKLISRSEARRVATGLQEFGEVVLDFDAVDQVGQGFADELFRVWASSHPEVVLSPINMTESVAAMVTRHFSQSSDDGGIDLEVESMGTASSGEIVADFSLEFISEHSGDGSNGTETG